MLDNLYSNLIQHLNVVTLSGVEGLTVTRSYEPDRDVLTQIKKAFGTDVILQYEYTNDALQRRESMTTSGLAFDSVEPNPAETSDSSLGRLLQRILGKPSITRRFSYAYVSTSSCEV